MALISEIRKKSWLLLVLIGLGLAGFIIMDMTSNSQRAGSQFRMGSVDGKKIEWDAFQQLENTLYKNSTSEVYGRRDYIWNFLVDEHIVKEHSEEIGLAVTKPELMELQFGANLSPVVQQRFANQNTGQVDRNQLNQIKQSIENGSMTEEVRPFWAFQEKEILKERLQAKINSIVSKGMYIPTWMAEMELKDRQSTADILFAKIPYDKVDDKSVSLTDADYKAYIAENKKKLVQTEEVRKIAYASFPVVATAADTLAIYNELAALIGPFSNAESDSTFVESNGGTSDKGFYKRAEMGPAFADSAFSKSVGSIFGPMVDDGKMKLIKITGRQIVPDSVRSRHILRPATNATELEAATKLIDSLKTVIQSGKTSFDSLAMKFGTDGTSTKGGDLGFVAPGTMVKPFNDLIFYEAKPGELKTVVTQFGVHLVQVTGVKAGKGEYGIQMAQITEIIAPSEETQNKILSEIQQILTTNTTIEAFKKAMAKNEAVQVENSGPVKRNDYSIGPLGAAGGSRDIIRWAYGSDASVGNMSPDVYSFQEANAYYVNKYVVAGLDKIIPKGTPGVDDIREDIELAVKNKKKAEVIISKLKGKDLAGAAGAYSVSVDTAKGVSFASTFIPGLGNEMKVVGTSMALANGQTSAPIEGTSGVFVIQMLGKSTNPTAASMTIDQVKEELKRTATGPIQSRFIAELRKNSSIEDERYNFY